MNDIQEKLQAPSQPLYGTWISDYFAAVKEYRAHSNAAQEVSKSCNAATDKRKGRPKTDVLLKDILKRIHNDIVKRNEEGKVYLNCSGLSWECKDSPDASSKRTKVLYNQQFNISGACISNLYDICRERYNDDRDVTANQLNAMLDTVFEVSGLIAYTQRRDYRYDFNKNSIYITMALTNSACSLLRRKMCIERSFRMVIIDVLEQLLKIYENMQYLVVFDNNDNGAVVYRPCYVTVDGEVFSNMEDNIILPSEAIINIDGIECENATN